MNTDTIGALASDLGSIRRTLENSERNADDLAAMIPHDRLASVVLDFSGKWERRRAELTEHVQVLEDKARNTADAFEEVDNTQADGLEEQSG